MHRLRMFPPDYCSFVPNARAKQLTTEDISTMKFHVALLAGISIMTLAAFSANAQTLPPAPNYDGCAGDNANTCSYNNGQYCYDVFADVDSARRPANRPVRGDSCWFSCNKDGYSCTDRDWWGWGTCVDDQRFYEEDCNHADQCDHGAADMACYQRSGDSSPKCVLDEEAPFGNGNECSCWFGPLGGWCESSQCNGHYCSLSSFQSWSYHCSYQNDTSFGGFLWDYLVNGNEESDKNNCPH
jgi:hypothetical protein